MLPPTVTYHCTLPNITEIIQNHWSILKTNKTLEKTFLIEPFIAFCKNKSLKQVIIGNKSKTKNYQKIKQRMGKGIQE